VKWSVGVRTANARESNVGGAFDAGEIVRSWPLRGTLHLVLAADLPWLLSLTAARSLASVRGRREALGLSDSDMEQARAIVEEALPGRRALGRAALLATIEAGGVSTAGQRGYHILWYLAQSGTLVLGPCDGAQQAFARLDAWIPNPRRPDRDQALGELARRYFLSHGPATVDDLARWSGLTMRDARRGLEVGAGSLATTDIDGTSYHLDPAVLDAAGPTTRVVLLPGFDEYLLGYRDRSAVLAPEHADAIVPGGNGMFKPTVVADGEVVGTWSRRAGRRAVQVDVAPFARLPQRALDGLETAADAYGRYLGKPVRLVIAGRGRQRTSPG